MALEADHLKLGQFIPLHYHHNMLNDRVRMQGFKQAIDLAVKPGAKVLELGGGTGVQSFFAAQKASQVWCVELNPELVASARAIMQCNPNGHKVEIIQADADQYLPPEPVDVVICEMLHTGLLREKQLSIIDSFKTRYLDKFGGPLPVFIPEACVQAIQPVQQSYNFEGYYAPVILFQDPTTLQPDTSALSEPTQFQIFSYHDSFSQTCAWNGVIQIEQSGQLNALRMITKNILQVDVTAQNTVDWHTQHIVFPLKESLPVKAGDQLAVNFNYQGGDPLNAFSDLLEVSLLSNDQR